MNPRLLTVASLAIGFATPALAQEKSAACDGPQDACQQIVSIPKKWEAAFNKKDAAGAAALYAQDAILVPEGPIVSGREAIQKFWSAAIQAGFSDAVVNTDQVRVAGDVAWGAGDWRETGPGPNHATQPFHGKWGAVFTRDGGTWGLSLDAVNTIESPPSQSGEGTSASR